MTLKFGLGEREGIDSVSDNNNMWAAVEDFLEGDLFFCVCPTEFVVHLEPTNLNM